MSKRKIYSMIITLSVLFTTSTIVIADDNLELSRAANNGEIEKVKALIKSGVDVNAWSNLGLGKHTPLMYAVYKGHYEVAKILIEAGADVNAFHPPDHTVLYHAIESYRQSAEIVQLLVDSGVNMDPNPLFWVVDSLSTAGEKSEVPKVMSILINAGAEVNQQDRTGFTVLMAAVFRGNNQLVDILLRSGAEINASTDDGRTALTSAVRMGYTETVRLLIKAGADLATIDESGNTPLMIAQCKDFEEIVELLKEAGAVK